MMRPGLTISGCNGLASQRDIQRKSALPNQPVNQQNMLSSVGFCATCFGVSIKCLLASRLVRSMRTRRRVAVLDRVNKKQQQDKLNVSRLGLFLQICSAVLCSLLFVGFAHATTLLNQLLVGCHVGVEAATYLLLAMSMIMVHRTGFIPSTVRSIIELIRQISVLLGLPVWRADILRKSKEPLVKTTNAMIVFLTVNLAINMIPQTWSLTVPTLLRFMDADGDGSMEASEIFDSCYNLSSRALGAYVVYQVLKFLMKTKASFETPVPDEATSPLATFLRGMQQLRSQRKGRNQNLPHSLATFACIDKVLSVVFWCAALVCWQNLAGVSMKTFAAIGGVGGLAFSFAARSIVQNAISGVLIFFNRTLVEGEEIANSSGKTLGVVSKIGLNTTMVHRLEGDKLIVPNSQLVDNSIINVERRDFWLVEKSFPIVLQSFVDLELVVAQMNKTVQANYDCDCGPVHDSVHEKPIVYFGGYGHQGASINVRAYLPGTLSRHEFYQAQSELLLNLNKIALSFNGAAVGLEAHFVGGGRRDLKGGHQDHESH